jgi:hypothetical protein
MDYSKLWVDMANKSSAINVYARVITAPRRMGIATAEFGSDASRGVK